MLFKLHFRPLWWLGVPRTQDSFSSPLIYNEKGQVNLVSLTWRTMGIMRIMKIIKHIQWNCTLLSEHKCKPCPEKWVWHEDSCYGEFKKSETWQQSDFTCSTHNASLVKIKSRSVLVRSSASLLVRREVIFPKVE